MAKYGWKEGQGLGREEQGLSTCLQVEKTGKRAGKIINKDVEKKQKVNNAFAPLYGPPVTNEMPPPPPPPEVIEEQKENNITNMMKNPSKVVLLKVTFYKIRKSSLDMRSLHWLRRWSINPQIDWTFSLR